MIIPYSIASYKRSDLPQIVLRNLFAEKTPQTPNQLVLLPRGGLASYMSVGDGPIRGFYYQAGALDDALFTVSGSSLYNSTSAIGLIGGTGRVQMAATINVLLVATGDALYSSDGSTVEEVAFPDGAGAVSVAFLGGYAVAARTDSRRIYFTLDPSTWDGLDYVSTEGSAANIVGFALVADQLWVFTEDKTYVFVLTGNPDTPIQALPGRVFEKGALARDTITTLDNTVFWVGSDGIVYRADNTPLRISDNGIEELIAASSLADLGSWTYPWFGHTFLVLHTTGGTRVYDAATQQWHEVASYGRSQWRAGTGFLYGRLVLAGDTDTGQVWQVDPTYSVDATVGPPSPLERVFTILLDKPGYLDRLTIDCTVGDTEESNETPGIVELRTSRDGGMSWTEWRQVSLGYNGQYRQWPSWRGLGLVDEQGMVIQVRDTSPWPWRISNVRVNDSAGGRSR
jgi:hypothetical protein